MLKLPIAPARTTMATALRQALAAPRIQRGRQLSARVRYGLVVVAVGVATVLMTAMRDHLGALSIILLYLLLCFILTLFVGSGPAALAAVLAVLAFNYFFVPPIHTFDVAQTDNLVALFVFLGVAVITGRLVANTRARAEVALREQDRTALLYELNAALIGDVTLDAILATIVASVVQIYGARSGRILLPNPEGRLEERARFPESAMPHIDRQSLAMASLVMERGRSAGRSRTERRVISPAALRPSDADVLYLPIATTERRIGVLGVDGRPGGGRFAPEDEQLLETFAAQAALALERTRLTRAAAEAAALAESDALKTALLASLSHDLRTPLAVIKASSSSLLDSSVPWDDEARSEFLHAIDEETDRLARMVDNLLDLTRIEGGTLHPDMSWYDIAELAADVANRPAARSSDHPLRLEISPDLPLVCFDYVKIAQVLVNLIENAIKYTPAGTPVVVSARAAPHAVELAVTDAGPGIPADELDRVFDSFYRSPRNARIPGTGIGLSIARGFVAAHGGRIWAERREGGGTSIRFTLPVETVDGERNGE
jgi:two-component system sensor histidine kinase KdpD